MNKFLIVFLLFSSSLFSQLTDLARVEYSYFPQKESENSLKRFRAYVNYPIKLSDKGNFIVVGLEYRNVSFKFNDNVNFDNSNLDNLDSYEFTLGYTYKINEELRFAASSGFLIASNFENKGVVNDDILYSGEVFLIKDKTKDSTVTKPWRLIAGLGYSTTTGFPFPLPIINYYRKFRPNWTYAIGIPNSNIKYFLTKKHIVQSFATLDGFYANIQRKRQIPIENSLNTNTASSMSMTVALAGLGYEYFMTKHLVFYTYAGHTFINSIRLRDDNRDDVYKINEKNSFYFRGGIKFNI